MMQAGKFAVTIAAAWLSACGGGGGAAPVTSTSSVGPASLSPAPGSSQIPSPPDGLIPPGGSGSLGSTGTGGTGGTGTSGSTGSTGSTQPSDPSSASGLYRGSTNTDRTAAGILFDSGEFWLIYSAPANPRVVAGAEHGTVTLGSGKISANLKDYNLEGLGISSGTMTGTYSARQNITGTVTFQHASLNFSTSFDSASAVPASLSAVAGSYFGTAATVAGFDAAAFTVSQDGTFAGVTVHSCQFSGTAAPDAHINAYHVTIAFAGGTCSNGTDTVVGAAYFDPASRTLYVTALNAAETNGVLFTGVKQ
jgi:hypothetical protein